MPFSWPKLARARPLSNPLKIPLPKQMVVYRGEPWLVDAAANIHVPNFLAAVRHHLPLTPVPTCLPLVHSRLPQISITRFAPQRTHCASLKSNQRKSNQVALHVDWRHNEGPWIVFFFGRTHLEIGHSISTKRRSQPHFLGDTRQFRKTRARDVNKFAAQFDRNVSQALRNFCANGC